MNRFTGKCDSCGAEIRFKSNQPGGCRELFICECYKSSLWGIPAGVTGKYLYKKRDDTLKFQYDIIKIIEDIQQPMTVRQIYYRLVASGYPKDDSTYNKTQRELLSLRECGLIPYGFIADNSRSFYKGETYSGLEAMLAQQQQYYRKDFWESQDCHVEIWLEKEALRNIFWEVTDYYQVPLYVTKGLSSVSFIWSAAEEIKRINKRTFVYFFSDYDPSGIVLTRSIERRMREFGVDAYFERAGLNPEQIEEYKVITRETKESNHSKGFRGESAELDALHPKTLKEIVSSYITRHVNATNFWRLQRIEEAEKETLNKILNNLRHAS